MGAHNSGQITIPKKYVWFIAGVVAVIAIIAFFDFTHESKVISEDAELICNEICYEYENYEYYKVYDPQGNYLCSCYDSETAIEPLAVREIPKWQTFEEYKKEVEENTKKKDSANEECSTDEIYKWGECVSVSSTEPITHEFIFTRNLLIGSRESINFTTYTGLNDYLLKQERSLDYDTDFVLKNINNKQQSEQLKPLVEEIQSLSNNPDEQARIAISIAQMIPYGREYEGRDKYAYEVLHSAKGVCGEKSELIIYLLRELGFGTAYLIFENENHATAGIKCPKEYSYMKTGYCFIEATTPTLIGVSNNNYVDVGSLSYNPKIYVISEGRGYQDIINQVEKAKKELNNGTRFRLEDKNGAVILRTVGNGYAPINYPDVILEYPRGYATVIELTTDGSN